MQTPSQNARQRKRSRWSRPVRVTLYFPVLNLSNCLTWWYVPTSSNLHTRVPVQEPMELHSSLSKPKPKGKGKGKGKGTMSDSESMDDRAASPADDPPPSPGDRGPWPPPASDANPIGLCPPPHPPSRPALQAYLLTLIPSLFRQTSVHHRTREREISAMALILNFMTLTASASVPIQLIAAASVCISICMVLRCGRRSA